MPARRPAPARPARSRSQPRHPAAAAAGETPAGRSRWRPRSASASGERCRQTPGARLRHERGLFGWRGRAAAQLERRATAGRRRRCLDGPGGSAPRPRSHATPMASRRREFERSKRSAAARLGGARTPCACAGRESGGGTAMRSAKARSPLERCGTRTRRRRVDVAAARERPQCRCRQASTVVSGNGPGIGHRRGLLLARRGPRLRHSSSPMRAGSTRRRVARSSSSQRLRNVSLKASATSWNSVAFCAQVTTVRGDITVERSPSANPRRVRLASATIAPTCARPSGSRYSGQRASTTSTSRSCSR